MFSMAKRVVLFLSVNFLVIITISIISSIFGIQPYLARNGINYPSLLIFCLIWGMGGALISLMLSKTMAKWMMGVTVIDPQTQDPQLRQLVSVIHGLAKKANLPAMPEVAIFNSPELNAFATGPSKKNALVAVSTGLLQRMDSDEVEAVLGHEITHIANGDMVTMALLQGVVNAFVMFLARALAYAVSTMTRDREAESPSWMYYILVLVFEVLFMLLGALVVSAFSRYREFKADAGGAALSSKPHMISALQTLERYTRIQDPQVDQPAFQALKISSPAKFAYLFASHPPLEERIVRLQKNA